MDSIEQRIAAIRERIVWKVSDALLLYDSDPHHRGDCLDSYRVLSRSMCFPCTAGYMLVTKMACVVWVDARYHLAASEQMRGTPVQVHQYHTETEWLEMVARVLRTDRHDDAISHGTGDMRRADMIGDSSGHMSHKDIKRSVLSCDSNSPNRDNDDISRADAGNSSNIVLSVDREVIVHSTHLRWKSALAAHNIVLTAVDVATPTLLFYVYARACVCPGRHVRICGGDYSRTCTHLHTRACDISCAIDNAAQTKQIFTRFSHWCRDKSGAHRYVNA